MYGKLIDGILMPAPSTLAIGNKVYYNPSIELYVSQGYKEIIDTPYPEVGEDEIKYYEYKYEETDELIIKVWEEVESLVEDETEPSLEDRMIAVEVGLQSTQQELNSTMEALDYIILNGGN